MKIKNYEAAKNELRKFLPQFLAEHGIQTPKSFLCINPKHHDKNPSMGLLPDGEHVYCLSCGWRGDIFDCAHALDGRPNSGPGFILENLTPLAKHFDTKLDQTEMTQEESYELDCYRAYAAVAEMLIVPVSGGAVWDYVQEHGWSPEELKKLQIGILHTGQIEKWLGERGFSQEFLEKVDLLREDLFNGTHLVFTIHDHHGRPVGFSARNCIWKKGDSSPKYINTSTAKCPIFQKGRRLYGLYEALDYIRGMGNTTPLILFEGQTNVVTARHKSIYNTAAIGGNAFTEDHLLLLRDQGISSIVLCLDGDTAGQEKVEKLLDTRFANTKDISIKIIILPDNYDPDEFLREKGTLSFEKLAQWTAFEWRLLRFPEGSDPEQIAQMMIPHIVSERSYITQSKMCEALSNHTGIALKLIQQEVERLQDDHEQKLAQERSVILDQLQRSLRVAPHEAEIALHQTLTSIQDLHQKFNKDKFSVDTCIKNLDDERFKQDSKTDEFAGYRLGPVLLPLEEALAGDWKKDVAIFVGGKANSGKTSLLALLNYEIANHWEENNAISIYHSIDDTFSQFLPKWVCIAEGSRQLTINEVKDPQYYFSQGYKDVLTKRSVGYERIRNMMKNQRLILKDSNDGSSLTYMESLIRYYRENNPDKNIVFTLDNLHKLRDFASLDERIRFKTISEVCKGLATRYHITFLASVEYTKLAPGTKPTNNNVAESVQLEYDANVILHLYNDAHERGEEAAAAAGMTHTFGVHGRQKRLPVIEVIVGKNKITDFKNHMFLDFFPASSDFIGRNTDEVEEMMEQRREEIKVHRVQRGVPVG